MLVFLYRCLQFRALFIIFYVLFIPKHLEQLKGSSGLQGIQVYRGGIHLAPDLWVRGGVSNQIPQVLATLIRPP